VSTISGGSGGGVKIIPPTRFSGKVEIPDLRYCFPCDTVKIVKTVKMIMSRFLPNLPIFSLTFVVRRRRAHVAFSRPLSP
jgi:hypothetical protein